MQLRVRALETVLTEKGYIDPKALDVIIDAYETRSGRISGRASSPRPGPIRTSSAACSPMRPRRSPRSARAPRDPSDRGREHAAPPQHGRLHAVLLLSVGSARPAAGLVQVCALPFAHRDRSARRARRFRRYACRPIPKSGCGIRPQRRATSCVPMRPAGTEGWSEEKLASLVTRDAMIGTGLRPRAAAEAARHERRARHGRHAGLRQGRAGALTSRCSMHGGKAACSP